MKTKKTKLFVSFDYEGLAGVSNWKETYGNQRFNELATNQINAFLKGFYRRYPDADVVIADSHALGDNLIWEKLFGNVQLVKGYPRNFYMIEGLDSSFDALALFGYHAPVGIGGNMDHSYSSSCFYDIKIDGKLVDEASINSLVASHYDVPLKFVYADDVSINWISQNLSSDISFLKSKTAISRYAALMPSYKQILEELEAAGNSFMDAKGFLFAPKEQYECEISLLDSNIGYCVQAIPNIEKIDARKIRFRAKNPIELYQFLMTVIAVASSVRNLYK